MTKAAVVLVTHNIRLKFLIWPGTERSGKLKSPGVQHQAHSQPHQAQAQAHTQRVWNKV